MPRGGNNNQNLRPVTTKEEARKRGRAGGIKSGELRKQRKTMREAMAALLEAEVTPNITADLKKRGYKGEAPVTYNDAMAVSMLLQALKKGDVKAYTAVMELMGEKTQVLDINSSNEKFAEILDVWKAKKDEK